MWAVVVGSPLENSHNDDRSIIPRINLVNLGDAQIQQSPARPCRISASISSTRWRQENPVRLENDAFGYILTKVDFQSFPRYDYVSRTSLGEMTGEILIEKSLEFVNKSPRPE
jgi:hypothetical protein